MDENKFVNEEEVVLNEEIAEETEASAEETTGEEIAEEFEAVEEDIANEAEEVTGEEIAEEFEAVAEDVTKEAEAEAEDIKSEANDIAAKIKALVKDGNVTFIRIRKDDTVILNLPVTVGIIGTVIGLAAAPWIVIIATLTTLGLKCTVEVEKKDGSIVLIHGGEKQDK